MQIQDLVHLWALPDFQHHSPVSGKIYSCKCVCDMMCFEINSWYTEPLWFVVSELSIWDVVLYFKYVFSCAKMLHHSLFSSDFWSTIVYQGDLLADGLPDVLSIFCSEREREYVFKVKPQQCCRHFNFLRKNMCTGLDLNTLCVIQILCPN